VQAEIKAAEQKFFPPSAPATVGSCPACGATCIARIGSQLRCNQCAEVFGGAPPRTVFTDGYVGRALLTCAAAHVPPQHFAL
jgi:hypothetical protein